MESTSFENVFARLQTAGARMERALQRLEKNLTTAQDPQDFKPDQIEQQHRQVLRTRMDAAIDRLEKILE